MTATLKSRWAIAVTSGEEGMVGLRLRRRHASKEYGIYAWWPRSAGAMEIAAKLRDLAAALDEMGNVRGDQAKPAPVA